MRREVGDALIGQAHQQLRAGRVGHVEVHLPDLGRAGRHVQAQVAMVAQQFPALLDSAHFLRVHHQFDQGFGPAQAAVGEGGRITAMERIGRANAQHVDVRARPPVPGHLQGEQVWRIGRQAAIDKGMVVYPVRRKMRRRRRGGQHGIHQAQAQTIDFGGPRTAEQVQLGAGPIDRGQQQGWLVLGELCAGRMGHQRRNDCTQGPRAVRRPTQEFAQSAKTQRRENLLARVLQCLHQLRSGDAARQACGQDAADGRARTNERN